MPISKKSVCRKTKKSNYSVRTWNKIKITFLPANIYLILQQTRTLIKILIISSFTFSFLLHKSIWHLCYVQIVSQRLLSKRDANESNTALFYRSYCSSLPIMDAGYFRNFFVRIHTSSAVASAQTITPQHLFWQVGPKSTWCCCMNHRCSYEYIDTNGGSAKEVS